MPGAVIVHTISTFFPSYHCLLTTMESAIAFSLFPARDRPFVFDSLNRSAYSVAVNAATSPVIRLAPRREILARVSLHVQKVFHVIFELLREGGCVGRAAGVARKERCPRGNRVDTPANRQHARAVGWHRKSDKIPDTDVQIVCRANEVQPVLEPRIAAVVAALRDTRNLVNGLHRRIEKGIPSDALLERSRRKEVHWQPRRSRIRDGSRAGRNIRQNDFACHGLASCLPHPLLYLAVGFLQERQQHRIR